MGNTHKSEINIKRYFSRSQPRKSISFISVKRRRMSRTRSPVMTWSHQKLPLISSSQILFKTIQKYPKMISKRRSPLAWNFCPHRGHSKGHSLLGRWDNKCFLIAEWLESILGHSGHFVVKFGLWILAMWDLSAALLLKTTGHSRQLWTPSGSFWFCFVWC